MSFRKFYIGFLALLLLLFSCKKEESYQSLIIGHAGNGMYFKGSVYHDDSKEAVDLALSQNGCSGVEIDVQLSKDGTLWLYHDPYLEAESTLSGCIPNKTDSELALAKYRSFHQENLPKLLDLNLKNTVVFLDIKHLNSCEDVYVSFGQLTAQIDSFMLKNPTCTIKVITTNEDWLAPLLAKQYTLYFETESPEACQNLNAIYGIKCFMFKNQFVTKNQIEMLRDQNFETAIFEVRSPKNIRRALEKKADFLISDDVKAAVIERY